MTKSRLLAFQFLSLPYHKQAEIAVSLGIVGDIKDAPQTIDELAILVFQRASDMGKVDELRKLVEEAK